MPPSSQTALLQALASCNGGDGPTVDELARRLYRHPADVRSGLSVLVFDDEVVTCDQQGRYSLGSPALLLGVSA